MTISHPNMYEKSPPVQFAQLSILFGFPFFAIKGIRGELKQGPSILNAAIQLLCLLSLRLGGNMLKVALCLLSAHRPGNLNLTYKQGPKHIPV